MFTNTVKIMPIDDTMPNELFNGHFYLFNGIVLEIILNLYPQLS